jgi:hypothetical protein
MLDPERDPPYMCRNACVLCIPLSADARF